MFSEELTLQLSSVKLIADLVIPDNAEGLVIFSHGSGSSRLSTRNRFVADIIQDRGIATLLVDLLTPEEDSIVENRFDIDLLTGRLVQVTEWALKYPKTKELEILYFGASTGAASALRAAAYFGNKISAAVSIPCGQVSSRSVVNNLRCKRSISSSSFSNCIAAVRS